MAGYAANDPDAGDRVMATARVLVSACPPRAAGVAAGLFEIVPMVGPFLAFAPAVLVALADHRSDPGAGCRRLRAGHPADRKQRPGAARHGSHGRREPVDGDARDPGRRPRWPGLRGAFLAVPIAGAVQKSCWRTYCVARTRRRPKTTTTRLIAPSRRAPSTTAAPLKAGLKLSALLDAASETSRARRRSMRWRTSSPLGPAQARAHYQPPAPGRRPTSRARDRKSGSKGDRGGETRSSRGWLGSLSFREMDERNARDGAIDPGHAGGHGRLGGRAEQHRVRQRTRAAVGSYQRLFSNTSGGNATAARPEPGAANADGVAF